MTDSYSGTVPPSTGPTIPVREPVALGGLTRARARSAFGSAQEYALTLAEIVTGALDTNMPIDRIGEVRIRFEESMVDTPIEFPGPGSVVILDRDGECVGIYRDPPGQAEECPPPVSPPDPFSGGMSGGG